MSFLNSIEGFLGAGDTAAQAANLTTDANVSKALGDIANGNATDTALNQGMEGHRAGDAIASTSLLPDWAMKAIGPVMQTVAGAALRPNRNPIAPLGGSGHGVTANAASNGQAISQLEGLAGGDPLQGLTGFKNLL